jgi:hypothetical protein
MSASEQPINSILGLLTEAQEFIFGQQTKTLHGCELNKCG